MNQTGEIKKLRFGILCKSTDFQEWQARCIEFLMAHPQIEPVIVICESAELKEESAFAKYLNYPWKNLLFRVWNRFLVNIPSRRIKSMRNELGDCDQLVCETTKKKYSEYFQEEDIETIKNHQLDFILRFGFGIIRGEILNAARFGVWSFHHGDEQKYRGGPAGFWEIYNGDPVSGVILQRLTNKLDGGEVLFKGYFKTVAHSYVGNFDHLLANTVAWPLKVCKRLLLDGKLESELSQTNALIYKSPSNWQMLGMLSKLVINRIDFHLLGLFRAEEWNIGWVKGSTLDLIKQPDSFKPTFLPKPKRGTYKADPFGFIENGKKQVLFEDFDYSDMKGKVSQLDLESETAAPILEPDIHLSYPFILEHDGKRYFIPESFESQAIVLYELLDGSSKKVKNLVEGVAAVDPTLLCFNEKWWLFFLPKEPANTELWIYFSNELTGQYEPHYLNPVKCDISSSRPAGSIFIENGKLYRPAQDCSKTYGGAIVLHEITQLSETEFKERQVGRLEPFKRSDYPDGLHTINQVGDITLIDSKRYIFLWSNFRFHLKNKFRKLLGSGSKKS